MQYQKFPQPCSKKYHHLFVWCLKLKMNEFWNCKISFLKKHADLKTNCTRLWRFALMITYNRVLINQFVPPPFCLYFAFTGINFRVMFHHVCDVVYDENMSGPIRTRKWRSTNWLIIYMNMLTQKILFLLMV